MTDQVAMAMGHTLQDYAAKGISYVLTTRNTVQFTEKALDMAKRLVAPEDEVIVVDGGSTDDTTGIVAGHLGLVDVFTSEPDLSPSYVSDSDDTVIFAILMGWSFPSKGTLCFG